MKKKLIIGILAHVDAGKTTLSEALLYLSGRIRTYGRVDHGNTYLDTHAVERERGITVFSKQARFSTQNCDYILLDTPGHVDFSAEAERTLSLLDYAILVVSGTDGVQNHTRTLWQLLEHYGVPTLLFVNKTDIAVKQKQELSDELGVLSPGIIPFFDTDTKAQLDERLALLHEEFLNSFLAGEPIDSADVAQMISARRLFPCLFGSALRMQGVEFLLEVLDTYTLSPVYSEAGFGAHVFKIARTGNTRLTYMKVITTTTQKGFDKDEVTPNEDGTYELPTTVTLLVNPEQAKLLVRYENTGVMHANLVYRGDSKESQKFLDAQDRYFEAQGSSEGGEP